MPVQPVSQQKVMDQRSYYVMNRNICIVKDEIEIYEAKRYQVCKMLL